MCGSIDCTFGLLLTPATMRLRLAEVCASVVAQHAARTPWPTGRICPM